MEQIERLFLKKWIFQKLPAISDLQVFSKWCERVKGFKTLYFILWPTPPGQWPLIYNTYNSPDASRLKKVENASVEKYSINYFRKSLFYRYLFGIQIKIFVRCLIINILIYFQMTFFKMRGSLQDRILQRFYNV